MGRQPDDPGSFQNDLGGLLNYQGSSANDLGRFTDDTGRSNNGRGILANDLGRYEDNQGRFEENNGILQKSPRFTPNQAGLGGVGAGAGAPSGCWLPIKSARRLRSLTGNSCALPNTPSTRLTVLVASV